MATRYSGPDTTINIVYSDGNRKLMRPHYHTTISVRGKHVWTGDVEPPQMLTAHSPLNKGYDSSEAYDAMASTALAFYVNDMEERGERSAGDSLDYGDQDYMVRRQKAYR